MNHPRLNSNIDYRIFLLEMLPKNSVGAEVGVHMGDFSKSILDVVQPSNLYLIDPWKHEPSANYKQAWYGGLAKGKQQELDQRHRSVLNSFDNEIQAGKVVVCRESSSKALSKLPDNSLDWVYIDGNHRYEFIAQDLQLSMSKVKPGGLITGDDYTEGGWWQGSVKRAVDELIATGRVEVVLIRNRQYILKKLWLAQS